MNTTTNTRVSEAMVDAACDAYDKYCPDAPIANDGGMRYALEAALSAPEPAAQEEEGFDARKYVRHMADVLEAGGDLFKVDADLLRLAAAINKAANTAPPAQPERVPEGWRVLQIGAVGSAYDPPNTRRAFTYDWQPGNGGAWALGMASSTAAKTSAGDYIDGGLNLLKALQEQGFGVFQIEPSATPAAPADGDGKEGVR